MSKEQKLLFLTAKQACFAVSDALNKRPLFGYDPDDGRFGSIRAWTRRSQGA